MSEKTLTEIKESILDQEDTIKGRYSLGVHPSVGLFTLGTFLPGLLAKYKELEFRLVHDLSRKITEEIISFKIDFGIVVNPISHPDLVIREIYKDEVIFCRSKKLTSNNDLESDCNVLLMDPDLIQSQDLISKVSRKRFPFKRTITSSNLEIIKKLILSGSGIGILPTRVAGEDLKKLENLSLGDFPKFSDRICLIFRADAQKAKAARKLEQYIFEALKET